MSEPAEEALRMVMSHYDFLRDLDAGRVELSNPPPLGVVPIEFELLWLIRVRDVLRGRAAR